MYMSFRRGMTIIGALTVLLVALIALAFIVPNSPSSGQTTAHRSATPTITPSPTIWNDPQAGQRAAYTPKHIIIARMGLDADVMPVGATDDGSMATPHCISPTDPVCGEVYWWSGGVVPGETGNAVIAGHVNRPDASPASFGKLSAMRVGDTVQIVATQGTTLTFVVTQVEVVSAYVKGGSNPIINQIFGPSSSPDLNLITCIGDWDGATFNERLVVHTQLQGPSPITQP
jgi:sortase A